MAHAMKPDRPRPEEVQFFRTYAGKLKESIQSGLLTVLIPYPHFVVWRYTLVDGQFKKPPYNPQSHLPAQVDNPASCRNNKLSIESLSNRVFPRHRFCLLYMVYIAKEFY